MIVRALGFWRAVHMDSEELAKYWMETAEKDYIPFLPQDFVPADPLAKEIMDTGYVILDNAL